MMIKKEHHETIAVQLITPAMFRGMSTAEEILDSETFLSFGYLIPSCYVHLGSS